MKQRYLLLAACLFLPFLSIAQPLFVSAKKFGGTSADSIIAMEYGPGGSVYTAGVFRLTADFDLNAGVFTLTATNAGDGFVSKTDASGNFLWAKQFGGTGYDVVKALAVDGSGNIYLTGQFNGTVDFDPDAGVQNMTAAGMQDAFVCKLDSNGNLLWAKEFGSATTDAGNAVALLPNGNVVTIGSFTGSVDFDPSAAAEVNLAAAGGTDLFFSVLDAEGNYVDARRLGGAGNEALYAFTKDGSGNLYLTGPFTSATDFDPGPGTVTLTPPSSYSFVCKLSPSLDLAWARMIGNAGGSYCYGIAVDYNGNVYGAGDFRFQMDFDPGTGTSPLTATGNGTTNDVFFFKWNEAGEFLWAKRIGHPEITETCSNIAVDRLGEVYLAGHFGWIYPGYTVDFDPDAGVANLTTIGTPDAYYAKYTTNGNYLWARNIGGGGGGPNATLIKTRGIDLTVLGTFSSSCCGGIDFDPGPGVVAFTGSIDAFVLQLSQPGVLPVTMQAFTAKWQGEKRAELTWQTATEHNTNEFVIERSADGQNFSMAGTVPAVGNSSVAQAYSFFDVLPSDRPLKLYYRLKTVDRDGQYSYSKVVQLTDEIRNTSLFRFSPNPAQSFLQITVTQVGHLHIYDAAGRQVAQYPAQFAGFHSMAISSFTSGVYHLVFRSNDGKTQTASFVKK